MFFFIPGFFETLECSFFVFFFFFFWRILSIQRSQLDQKPLCQVSCMWSRNDCLVTSFCAKKRSNIGFFFLFHSVFCPANVSVCWGGREMRTSKKKHRKFTISSCLQSRICPISKSLWEFLFLPLSVLPPIRLSVRPFVGRSNVRISYNPSPFNNSWKLQSFEIEAIFMKPATKSWNAP